MFPHSQAIFKFFASQLLFAWKLQTDRQTDKDRDLVFWNSLQIMQIQVILSVCIIKIYHMLFEEAKPLCSKQQKVQENSYLELEM